MTSCDIVGVPDNASGKYVVKINTEDMVLAPGETASRPSTNATATTTYTSSDPAVATVDNAGRVTAVAEGTCVITVSTPFLATKTIEGDEILSTATAEYKVIVAKKAGSISFAEAAINKEPGDAAFTNKLTVVGDGKVTFESSDANVATVDAEGKVTIIDEGTATITATVEDSKTYKYETNTASFTLTVAPALDPAKAYLKWDNTKEELVATPIPATYNTVSSVPGGPNWTAGTYVVEGQVTISGVIILSGNVNLIIKDGAKLTAKGIRGYNNNLSIYGQAQKSGELVVDGLNNAIYEISILEVHSCQVTATTSEGDCSGFFGIKTINVYGGSVDAENTGVYGSGIKLPQNGSMNIYGGEVKAVGKGNYSGIGSASATTVTVDGGKLWAENAGYKAINTSYVTLTTSSKIETSSDGNGWTKYTQASTPNAKYVRVGY